MSVSEYQAGVCNIGAADVNARKKVARVGSLAFAVTALVLAINGSPSGSAAIAFIPALVGAIGFVQSRKKFCLAFGLMGTFNFAELGKISKVASKAEIAADRKQALKIILQSIGLALIPTMALSLLLSI